MRLNSTGEVPVLIHGKTLFVRPIVIIDYLEQTFLDGNVKAICDFFGFTFNTNICLPSLPPIPPPLLLSLLPCSYILPSSPPSFLPFGFMMVV